MKHAPSLAPGLCSRKGEQVGRLASMHAPCSTRRAVPQLLLGRQRVCLCCLGDGGLHHIVCLRARGVSLQHKVSACSTGCQLAVKLALHANSCSL